MTTNKLKNNENFNISEGNVKENNIFPNDNVKKSHNEQTLTEINCKVPSYEDWQKLHKRLKDTQDLELKVRKENQQLKELIKECSLLLRKQTSNDEVDFKESVMLVSKIDEVVEDD